MHGRRHSTTSNPALNRRALLAAAGAAALTAACGTAAGRPPGEVALHGDNPSWDEPIAAAGRRMKTLAGIELVPLVIPSVESFEQIVKSSLRTSKTPDMLKYWSGYRLQDLARTGGIIEMTGPWKRAAARGWVDPELRGAFTYQGRVWALPMNLTYWVFFYNTEVFAQHDLEAPKTWDDFLAVCKRFKSAGITPLHATTDGRWPAFIWFMEVLTRQDPRFYQDLMNGRGSYNDPRAVRALRTIVSFFDNDWFTPMDMSHDDAAAAVVHGTLGMMPGGTFLTPNLQAAGGRPGADVDAFVLPMADPRARPSMIFESSALVCTSKGPDRAEAVKAADQWLHPRVSEAFTHTLQDGCPNPLVKPANPMVEGIARTVREKRLWMLNRFWEQGPPELVESTVDDLAGFLLDPSSYRQVLRTMQERADEAWRVWREAEKV
ncbi:multiple sugar transport system substrate-binding protein [Streptomyces sp. Amel2xB2]|uniref:ABC transporter substrate-binding protein n=1 Tax=Streptomyces sp. Amel2xB2 TaxID=1305829 RepID=UPI000DC00853|nr:extracellular solute-binding protein [Streptomyces sp. Amel2xB2]RAJ59054.1 multiple sugar transport system substrate-binding protein [Streptomyces sp. Amel2xB2]